MATSLYKRDEIILIDGTRVDLEPLKIKYLKFFMETFEKIEHAESEDESIDILSECATICMHQNYPLIQTKEDLQDSVDLPTMYKVLEVCANIKINPEKDSVDTQAKEQENKDTWKNLDLASLEAEIFITGSWKNFDELESSINMSELIAILEKMRELDYNEKKFFAAIQGVDLDKESGNKQDEWEKMKARVFSGGSTSDPDDILSLQGQNAEKAGFGIGMGLEYQKM